MTEPAGSARALLAEADRLYALGLPEFTAARDARVKELRAVDRDLAAQVRTLRKPSLAAWVVNLLARRESEQVAQVLAVGAALREAQAALDGEELRELTRQRRQLVAAVTTRARGLAAAEGVRVTPAVAEQVEATLTAAILDPGAADAVRSGLLTSALAATGVGELDLSGSVALAGAVGFVATPAAAAVPPQLSVVPDPEADAKELAGARDRLADAEAVLQASGEDVAAAAGRLEEATARSLQVQAELDELRRRLAEVEEGLDEVDGEIMSAEDALDAARREEADARRSRDAAAARVNALEARG